MKLVRFFLVVLLACLAYIKAAEVDNECEVCVGVLTKFKEAADTQKIKEVEDYEKMFRKECDAFTNPKEKRLCWYLGAAKDSATNVLREVSRPLSIGMPPLNVCRKLKRFDPAICALRYVGSSVHEPEPEKEKKPKKPKKVSVNWDKVPKMRIKELKTILSNLNEACSGCAEKSDFVSKILSLRSKYDLKTEL